MRKLLLITVALFSVLIASSVQAQETFENEWGNFNFPYAPLVSHSPYTIHVNQLNGLPYTELEWHAYGHDTRVSSAAYSWNNTANMPPWVRISIVESTIENADFYFAEGTCPNSNALGCYGVSTYAYSASHYIYTSKVSALLIQHSVWSTKPEIQKQATFAHEIGHMLGLGHVNNSGCWSSATIMETADCVEGYGISYPSSGDGLRMWRYWEACEGQSWSCSRLSPYAISFANSTVTTSWDSKAWNALYAILKIYTSENKNGPWLYKSSVTQTPGIHFKEDAVDYNGGTMPTGNNYRFTRSIGVTNVASGMWVRVCARPWNTFTTYGYENCVVVQN